MVSVPTDQRASRSRVGSATMKPATRTRATLRWLDRLLAVELVGLTFLLGCFLDRDTDIWWHLRAGREILRGGGVPRTDSYIFGARGAEWIDLHWGFQVAAAWIFAHAGFAALTLATAVTAALAVAIALAATARGRPVVALVWCLLPAVYVMSARFYPRPEILSLVFLGAVLFILHEADGRPWLLWLLVPLHFLWVNVHALFVLGVVLLGCWLVDRTVRSVMWGEGQDWRRLLTVLAAVVAACFVNPYTWKGAIFPLTLFRRMSTERGFYGRHIGELTSIPDIVLRTGVTSVYVRISFLLLAAAAASFALRPVRSRLSVFRLLAFGAFAGLGLLASRNQPQYALVAGVVLAWNVSDWLTTRSESPYIDQAVARILSSAVLVGLMLWVATGRFYAYAGEGRVVGLGEQPFWYAHGAATFAAGEGMPRHFLAYHEGQAAVLEFHMRPDQRVFVDPRLEVSPRTALEEYYEMATALGRRDAGWGERLLRLPQPLGILVDHGSHHPIEATLLTNDAWRCVWFDAIAGVYVPGSATRIVAEHAVDFGARYFGAGREPAPSEADGLFQVARDLLAAHPAGSADRRLGRVLLLLAAADARPSGNVPSSLVPVPVARLLAGASLGLYGYPDNDTPVGEWPTETTLGVARARFLLSRGIEQASTDFQASLLLFGIAQALGDPDALWVAGTRLAALRATTAVEFEVQRQARVTLRNLMAVMAAEPPLPLPVDAPAAMATARELTAQRRFLRAIRFLERSLGDGATADAAAWESADLRAMLYLVSGDPRRARALWSEFTDNAEHRTDAARRLANVDFVEGRLAEAITSYRTALAADPRQAHARYGLAIALLERGDASGFVGECRFALESDGLSGGPAEFCREMSDVARPYAQAAGQRDSTGGRVDSR
jgi:tetratricopeptide (TPR) repeat protein